MDRGSGCLLPLAVCLAAAGNGACFAKCSTLVTSFYPQRLFLLPAGPGGTDRLLRNIALVLTHRQALPADEPSSSAASSDVGSAAAQLALLAARAARASVVVAASRGWPALASLMLPHVMADSRCGAGWAGWWARMGLAKTERSLGCAPTHCVDEAFGLP